MYYVDNAGDGWYKFYLRISPQYITDVYGESLVGGQITQYNYNDFPMPNSGCQSPICMRNKYVEFGWDDNEYRDFTLQESNNLPRFIERINVYVLPSAYYDNALESWGTINEGVGAGSGVLMWGSQLETIKPYEDVTQVYQPKANFGEVGVYDFYPDVDARNPLSLDSEDGNYSVLTKYYDEELQPSSNNLSLLLSLI